MENNLDKKMVRRIKEYDNVYISIESNDLKTKFDKQMDFVLKQIEENK